MGRTVRNGNEIAKLHAGNEVEVIVYAVEKSPNSYKLNLLHCKQTFISQPQSGTIGVHIIDEEAMCEKSGIHSSFFNNIDFPDKLRLEKWWA